MSAAAKNNKARNATRIAAALTLRASKHASRITARNQAAYMLAVQQLAAQYGMPAPTQAQRAVNSVQRHAPSNIPGACKTVRTWVAANPLATVQEAKEFFANKINPATVATQFGIARKQAAAA